MQITTKTRFIHRTKWSNG